MYSICNERSVDDNTKQPFTYIYITNTHAPFPSLTVSTVSDKIKGVLDGSSASTLTNVVTASINITVVYEPDKYNLKHLPSQFLGDPKICASFSFGIIKTAIHMVKLVHRKPEVVRYMSSVPLKFIHG